VVHVGPTRFHMRAHPDFCGFLAVAHHCTPHRCEERATRMRTPSRVEPMLRSTISRSLSATSWGARAEACAHTLAHAHVSTWHGTASVSGEITRHAACSDLGHDSHESHSTLCSRQPRPAHPHRRQGRHRPYRNQPRHTPPVSSGPHPHRHQGRRYHRSRLSQTLLQTTTTAADRNPQPWSNCSILST
jgi:hypothetical protein